jgi:hypothetical protein
VNSRFTVPELLICMTGTLPSRSKSFQPANNYGFSNCCSHCCSGEDGRPAVKDAYEGLKKLVLERFSQEHRELPTVIRDLEESTREHQLRETDLAEQVQKSGAARDENVLAVATALLQKLKQTPGGIPLIEHIQQSAIGEHNFQAGRDLVVNVPPGKI